MIHRWVLGRAADCDIRVDDEYASPRHCRVVAAEDGSVTVEDLGSTNGTRLRPPSAGKYGGVRVLGPTPLRVGDVIQVGRTDITWTGLIEEDAEVAP